MVTLMPLLFYRIKHLKRHSPVSMNSLPGCCSFAGRFYRLTKEQHPGKLLILAWTIPTQLFLSLQSFPVILFLLTETKRFWFRIVFGISGFFFCKVIAYLANSKSWFGNNLPFPWNMQKSILPIRLALLPCTHFEKQKKLPDPKSERT